MSFGEGVGYTSGTWIDQRKQFDGGSGSGTSWSCWCLPSRPNGEARAQPNRIHPSKLWPQTYVPMHLKKSLLGYGVSRLVWSVIVRQKMCWFRLKVKLYKTKIPQSKFEVWNTLKRVKIVKSTSPAFEHLVSLGPKVWHFAAAETSTTPKVQICWVNEINHSACVVPKIGYRIWMDHGSNWCKVAGVVHTPSKPSISWQCWVEKL